MSSLSKMTVRVRSTRGATTIQYSTTGKYVSFTTAGLTDTLLKQPILSTANLEEYWLAVLALVQADITSKEPA